MVFGLLLTVKVYVESAFSACPYIRVKSEHNCSSEESPRDEMFVHGSEQHGIVIRQWDDRSDSMADTLQEAGIHDWVGRLEMFCLIVESTSSFLGPTFIDC